MPAIRFLVAFVSLLPAISVQTSISWRGPKLGGPAGEELMELIQNNNSSDVFCHLVKKEFHCKREQLHTVTISCNVLDSCDKSCDECAEEKAQSFLTKIKQQIDDLHGKSQAEPVAVFVLGGVASGKSGLVNKKLNDELGVPEFMRSVLHINADDIASDMVGGYEIYSAVSNNNIRDEKLWKYKQDLRKEAQSLAIKQKVNYLSDSLTLPASVAKSLAGNGYICQVFYLEVPGLGFKEKAEEAQRRVNGRVQQGGHSASVDSHQIQRSRIGAEKLKQLGINVSSFISTHGDFVPLWEEQCLDIFWPRSARSASRSQSEALGFLKKLLGQEIQEMQQTSSHKGSMTGFAIEYDQKTGAVKTLSVKASSRFTIQQLNCALIWFAELRSLILEGANVTGHLQDLALPLTAEKLQLSYCNWLTGSLRDTSFWALRDLKLEGQLISGDLNDLDQTQLKYLDLRGTMVTGDLSKLSQGELVGFWAQFTRIAGDITTFLQANPHLENLDLRSSEVTGSINDKWRQLGQKLLELRLSGSKVTFEMKEPVIESENQIEKVPKPFPLVTVLDLSNLQLNMDISEFLAPLMYNSKIVSLEAANCSLTGELPGLQPHKAATRALPTSFNFKSLNLASNHITALSGKPLPGCAYHLEVNPIKQIGKEYFERPSSLNIKQTPFAWQETWASWDKVFTVDNNSLKRDLKNGWECHGVKTSEMSSCKLEVSSEIFAPDFLCSCLKGFAGQGINCEPCHGDFEPFQDGNCCACPPNKIKTSVSFGSPFVCYRCEGEGCRTQSCSGLCSDGFTGTLCSYCADNYFRAGPGTCEECGRAHPQRSPVVKVLKYSALGGFLLLCFFGLLKSKEGSEGSEGRVKTKLEGQRAAELLNQGLVLLQFLQLALVTLTLAGAVQTPLASHLWYQLGSLIFSLIQLRMGDLLAWFRMECDLGYVTGRQIECLASAYSLPSICILSLLSGVCRGHLFYAFHVCMILISMLFPTTIEASLSNLICVRTDSEKNPLQGASFYQEMPWVNCGEDSETLQPMLHLAVLLNAAILPGCLFLLAWHVNRAIWPAWSLHRWEQPKYAVETKDDAVVWHLVSQSLRATQTSIETTGSSRSCCGPAPSSIAMDCRFVPLSSRKSLQLFTAAFVVCVAEAG